jgi:two-component system sensor histidine kinase RegB
MPRSILRDNLISLVSLRWFIIAGCALLLALIQINVHLLQWSDLAVGMLLLYTIANLWVRRYSIRHAAITEFFFCVNLALDLTFFFAFITLTGGSANPFTLLFLLPVIVAAATVRPLCIWLITMMAIMAYSLLLWNGDTRSHVHAGVASSFNMHIIGMWLGLVCMAGLVAYFVAYMGRALLQRERELALARENALRDERLVALGTLAAGTAHQLGTPLGTMAIVLGELRADAEQTPADMQDSLLMLQEQVQRCKQVLATLGVHGASVTGQGGHAIRCDELPALLQQRFSEQHPLSQLHSSWQGAAEPTRILADTAILQALDNLVGNASDAAPDPVRVTGRMNADAIVLEIQDQGPGPHDSISEQLGKQPVSSKNGDGMGIGLMLAHAVIERLGGSISIQPSTDSGTLVRVLLSLAALRIDGSATDMDLPHA